MACIASSSTPLSRPAAARCRTKAPVTSAPQAGRSLRVAPCLPTRIEGSAQAAMAVTLALSLGLATPGFAFADDGLSPSERRAAALERRREILQAARAKAEAGAASTAEEGETSQAPSDGGEAKQAEPSTDLKAMLRQYSAPAPAAEAEAPQAVEDKKPEPPTTDYKAMLQKYKAPSAPEPKSAPEPAPAPTPPPPSMFSKPSPPPPVSKDSEPAKSESKASLLERLGQENKQAPAPVKLEDSKKEAAKKAEESKKAEEVKKAAKKKGGKRKGPLPAFFAELGIAGLFGGAVVGATKFEGELKEASKFIGRTINKAEKALQGR